MHRDNKTINDAQTELPTDSTSVCASHESTIRLSPCHTSPMDTQEHTIRVVIPVEAYTRLIKKSAVDGNTVEGLIAKEISKLVPPCE